MTCLLIPMLAITGKPDREWIHNRLLGLRQGPSYGSAVAGLSVGQGSDFSASYLNYILTQIQNGVDKK